jgi:hypothetical protein
MTSAGEGDMKERILLTRQEYSVLKERNEGDECGWSKVGEAPVLDMFINKQCIIVMRAESL